MFVHAEHEATARVADTTLVRLGHQDVRVAARSDGHACVTVRALQDTAGSDFVAGGIGREGEGARDGEGEGLSWFGFGAQPSHRDHPRGAVYNHRGTCVHPR